MKITTSITIRQIRSLQLLLLVFFGAIPAFNQSADWIPLVREIVVNYDDSLVRAHIMVQPTVIDTEDHLMYYWYKQNQINHNMGGYSGDLLHGEYLVFDDQKNMIAKGYYENGLKHGIWKTWDKEGIIKCSMEYDEGLLDGEMQLYNAQGFPIEERKYRHGILEHKSMPGQVSDTTKVGMKIWKSDKKDPQEESDSTVIDNN